LLDVLTVQKKSPFVSVIVLNFNGENYLEQCLSSLLETKYPHFEVIFVDNASTDSSLKIIEKTFGYDERLRIFRSTKNLGFSGGNNFGFSYANGDFIAFLNNDTIVDPEWLAVLVSAMEEDKTIGLAGSTILSIDGKQIQAAGELWSDYLLFLHQIGEGKSGNFDFLPIFEVSFADGCSMIARKEFLKEIGLFDPKIAFNYDDTLLSFKTWLAGKRVVTVSRSRVYHLYGASTRKYWNNHDVIFSNFRAKMCLMFDIHFNIKDLIKALFVLSFSITIESLFLLGQKNLPAFSANTHVFEWMLKNFNHVWKNRLEHWRNPKVTPEMLLSKSLRIKMRFPLCIMPSKLRSLIYKREVVKYENLLADISN
jgi:GT2 family glycosyltransferase